MWVNLKHGAINVLCAQGCVLSSNIDAVNGTVCHMGTTTHFYVLEVHWKRGVPATSFPYSLSRP